MAITAFMIDASAGAPSYTGQSIRQVLSGLLFNGSTRALGSQSGVVAGSAPTLTASSTTWSIGAGNFVVDAAWTTTQGAYLIASDTSVSGSVTAAGAVARTDSLDLRVDDTAIDGSGQRQAVFVYTAGNASTGAVPALAARSLRIATFNVPATGGGSPTVSFFGQYAVASGGVLPVKDTASRNAQIPSPYDGMVVYQRDVDQMQVYDGTQWRVAGYVPSGRQFVGTRAGTTDAFSAATMTALLTATLPSNAPAGTYSLASVFDIGSTSTTSGTLRVIDPNGVNLSGDKTINPITTGARTPVNFTASFVWGGGAGSAVVSAQVAAGTGNVFNPGARIDVLYIGP